MGRKGGLFKPPKYKHLAKIITLKSVTAAKKAASKLYREAKNAKRPDAVLRRARAAQQAANRAKASLNRRDLKPETRARFKKIANIYDKTADKLFKLYHKMKKD